MYVIKSNMVVKNHNSETIGSIMMIITISILNSLQEKFSKNGSFFVESTTYILALAR